MGNNQLNTALCTLLITLVSANCTKPPKKEEQPIEHKQKEIEDTFEQEKYTEDIKQIDSYLKKAEKAYSTGKFSQLEKIADDGLILTNRLEMMTRDNSFRKEIKAKSNKLNWYTQTGMAVEQLKEYCKTGKRSTREHALQNSSMAVSVSTELLPRHQRFSSSLQNAISRMNRTTLCNQYTLRILSQIGRKK